MGVVFYKQGNTHTVRGIKCELIVVSSRNRKAKRMPDGYFKSPEAAYGEDTKAEEKKETIEEIKKVKSTKKNEVLNIDNLTNKELRQAAKEHNIDNWDDARFKTLRRKLKACQQAI